MLSEKIKNANAALGALAGIISGEAWAVIRCIRTELTDAADQVEELENNLPAAAAPDETTVAPA